MYITKVAGRDRLIRSYVLDENRVYSRTGDIVVLVNFAYSDGDLLVHYHPGSKPSDWQAKAKLLYRAVKIIRSTTPMGRAVNIALMYTKLDVIEEMIFGVDYPQEGYYEFGDRRNCVIPGQMHGTYITPYEYS